MGKKLDLLDCIALPYVPPHHLRSHTKCLRILVYPFRFGSVERVRYVLTSAMDIFRFSSFSFLNQYCGRLNADWDLP